MKNNEMAQSSIGFILFGFLNVFVLDTDGWRAIDEYAYPIMFVAVMILIFNKFGWKGLFLTFRVIVFTFILILLALLTFAALAGIMMLFSDDALLVIFFGYSSTWSTLLCCIAVIGFVVLIWKLMSKLHWDID